MKRPPTRSGGKKVQPKVAKTEALKPSKAILNREAKRLAIHERQAKAKVVRLRPAVQFGKRVRTILISSVAALTVLVLVMVFSPVLAVKKIVITGTNRVSEQAIQKDLKFLIGKPLPQVTSDEIARKLSGYELIDSVSAVSVPPNTLQVVVIERAPIAIVPINSIGYLYDPAGVQLGRAGSNDQFPVIQNVGNPSTSKSFRQAIDVLLTIPVNLLPRVASISALTKDNVLLTLRTKNQKILWGDNSEPGLKAKVLNALMNHYESQWGITFDVSSPGQPSVY